MQLHNQKAQTADPVSSVAPVDEHSATPSIVPVAPKRLRGKGLCQVQLSPLTVRRQLRSLRWRSVYFPQTI